jgi:hypothetical protein
MSRNKIIWTCSLGFILILQLILALGVGNVNVSFDSSFEKYRIQDTSSTISIDNTGKITVDNIVAENRTLKVSPQVAGLLDVLPLIMAVVIVLGVFVAIRGNAS